MKMEYACSCEKVNAAQYDMGYINQSAIETLCSIFCYLNELSVNGRPIDTAIWADRLKEFSSYKFSPDYWAIKIGSGNVALHASLLTILMYNALAAMTGRRIMEFEPVRSNRAIIGSPLKDIYKDLCYTGYSEQLPCLDSEKRLDIPYYDIPITKDTYTWFTDKLSFADKDQTAASILNALPPILKGHSLGLNITSDSKPGYKKEHGFIAHNYLAASIDPRQAYVAHWDKRDVSKERVIGIDDTSRPVIQPTMSVRIINPPLGTIKTPNTASKPEIEITAYRLLYLNMLGGGVYLKRGGFESNQRAAINDWLRSAGILPNPAITADPIKAIQRIGRYGSLDDSGYSVIKHNVLNISTSDVLALDKASGDFSLLLDSIRFNKLSGSMRIQNIFRLEKAVRRNLLICHVLLNASKSGAGKRIGIQETMRNYLRYSDIISMFHGGFTYGKYAKPSIIDALRAWYKRYAKPAGIEQGEGSFVDDSPEPVSVNNTGFNILNTMLGADKATAGTAAKKPQPALSNSDNEYIRLIKEFIALYDITENLIRTTMSRRANLIGGGKTLSGRPGLNAFIEQALAELEPPFDDISFLQDLELVLTNPLYKDIIIDENKIIIDAIPTEPEEEWKAEGIDELLIPNEEYPYASVKNDIFDFKTGLPKNHVKRIDDHTYIAKMPASNPIINDWEIGRKYIDVEVYWLKYMIDVFNRSWQSNIFKYGAMDMMSGINTMLEYMRLYAGFHVPGIAVEQCERAVSLIRWYAEYVLLKHSQFIIHIQYGHWESRLYTGRLDCDHELIGFEVTPTFVLQNTGQSAVLLLRNYVCIDSSIRFSLFLDGDVNIYINNVLTANLETGCSDIQIFALEAGSVEFRLDFTGARIKVGNIVIQNTHAVDIKTEYKYEYGKANFGINEVLSSVKAYYRVAENNLEAFKQAHDGIIGLNDLTNQLKEYMELHHINQQKGKRRTIKRL